MLTLFPLCHHREFQNTESDTENLVPLPSLSIATDVSSIHQDARFPKHVTEVWAKVSCIGLGRVHRFRIAHLHILYSKFMQAIC